ncbi:AEC family transporter [Roseimicrobium sp. ORNL1]|uniref:AEC family transporter n=1 Tax=Roseimicrobium sp. ORNL1 TaxID=2711231 RepID=UPI0013E11C8C|nr:AEC family transporter [Roseimicrobium sp. ORNL1]QIF04842.1 AEC family transporter [Roseimicrobium sp. ORNL1]
MLSTFLIVLPVFALILAGWLTRRMGVFGPRAAGELNRFVVYLALPALLFDIIARAHPSEIWLPGFIGTFGLSCALAFVATLVIRWRGTRPLADAAIDALATSYPNTGYMGFPLALAAFGASAMTPTLIAAIITVCVVFAAAIVLIEIGLQSEKRPIHLIWKVGGSLVRNPLLVAPVLGAVFPLTGAEVPAPVQSFLKMLGGAASPCALVSLGLFLAEKPKTSHGDSGAVGLIMGMKLAVHPLAAWVLGKYVFHLPPSLLHPAVLLAALPTGTGPYMLAELYQREAGITSKAIIGSTLLSILTITAYLTFGR